MSYAQPSPPISRRSSRPGSRRRVRAATSPTPERLPEVLFGFPLLRQFLNLLLHFLEGFRQVLSDALEPALAGVVEFLDLLLKSVVLFFQFTKFLLRMSLLIARQPFGFFRW
jgi:hypothetical protein